MNIKSEFKIIVYFSPKNNKYLNILSTEFGEFAVFLNHDDKTIKENFKDPNFYLNEFFEPHNLYVELDALSPENLNRTPSHVFNGHIVEDNESKHSISILKSKDHTFVEMNWNYERLKDQRRIFSGLNYHLIHDETDLESTKEDIFEILFKNHSHKNAGNGFYPLISKNGELKEAYAYETINKKYFNFKINTK